MTPTELRSQARLELFDTVKPFLWSNSELMSFISDAQEQFVRGTWGLPDATSPLTQLAFDGTTDWVPIDPLILRIRGAINGADGKEVDRINYEDLAPLNLKLNGAPGRLRYLIIGMERNKIRLFPFPESAGTISLLVDRLPLEVVDDCDTNLEIDAHHHVNLLSWIKYRALSKQDTETFDKGKAEEFKAVFVEYMKQALIERHRNTHVPRPMEYGGI